eukprot:gene21730-27783_t
MDSEFRSKNSANVDDSGNFSVQVLRHALKRANNLDLEPWFQHSNDLPAHGTQDQFEYRQGTGEWYSEDELLGVGKGGAQAEPVNPFSGKGNKLGGGGSSDQGTSVDERDFQVADEEDDEEMMLAKAISASMETHSKEVGGSAGNPVVILSAKDEMRAKRLAALEKRGH